jgi:uncharacterized protein
MGNPVTSFQILTPRPDEHAAFYNQLFGWRVNADNPLGYRQFDTGSLRGIQGGVWPAPPQAAPCVQLFVETEDAAASLAQALSLGAEVLIPLQPSRKARRWPCCAIPRVSRSPFSNRGKARSKRHPRAVVAPQRHAGGDELVRRKAQ